MKLLMENDGIFKIGVFEIIKIKKSNLFVLLYFVEFNF